MISYIERLVGGPHVRDANEHDAIDGVQPGLVVEPGSIQEAAEVMRLASSNGLAMVPRGAGTELELGSPPSKLDILLSTARLNRVVEHAAGDLVVTAEAGVTLSALQRVVAQAGQRLSIDPSNTHGTLGGLIATNASGPLRLRYGTLRDLLIGVTYILPNGTVARAGGKVVKNVAGYDLCKLFTGSLGTLGLLVEVILRLHPLPAARRIVTVTVGRDARAAAEAVQTVLHSMLVPSALEIVWESAGTLIVLFEGIEPGVEAQARSAEDLLQQYGTVSRSIEPKSMKESEGDHDVQLKISAVPSRLPEVIEAVESSLLRRWARNLRVSVHGRAGSGITLVSIWGDVSDAGGAVVELREGICRLEGTLVVTRAPVQFKRQVDVWGPAGNALPLMRRVKALYDPQGIMSPGRFVGGI